MSGTMSFRAMERAKQQKLRPDNYIPGLGRGATGFTTRSDIGPARTLASQQSESSSQPAPPPPSAPHTVGQAAPAGYVAGRGRGQKGFGQTSEGDVGDRGDYSDANFNEWSGFGGSLFSGTPYESDDAEADRVWTQVDDKMDERRREKREKRLKEELEKYRRKVPTIQRQFADLKRGLNEVSSDDWLNIPEAGEMTKRKHKNERDKLTPVPDSLLGSAIAQNQTSTSVDPSGLATPSPGSAGAATPHTDLRQIGEGRSKMLELKLQRMSDNVQGQTVVDPKGYLTGLATKTMSSDADIGDIKEARLLLDSARQSNKKHPPAWIAAARLEVIAGKVVQARQIIMQGCQACPSSEDLWLEAARLHTPESAKRILAQAVQHLPQAIKVWLAAAELETESKAKRNVMRKALEYIPDSVRLWKAAVELETEGDAKLMLRRAVEDGCCPLSVDLWLALAQLEEYEQAKITLGKARDKIPSEPSIWLTAAKLEEANSNKTSVGRIIDKALQWFSQQQIKVANDRDFWLGEAENAEEEGFRTCAGALVHAAIGLGVHEADRKRIWQEDADNMQNRGHVHCARCVLGRALSLFPTKKGLWMKAALLEKRHGTSEELSALLERAVSSCPRAWQLWLMSAKEKWLGGDIISARRILADAFAANSDNEEIWLAAVKLENSSGETERARRLLERARDKASTERVWMKSALFERQQGDFTKEKTLLLEAVKHFPDFAKLWIMLIQVEGRLSHTASSTSTNSASDSSAASDPVIQAQRTHYMTGLKSCPRAVQLWLQAVECEASAEQWGRARSLLEKARVKVPKNELLWLATVRLEAKIGEEKLANNRLAQALQECPHSGILWSESINRESRARRKARAIDAIKACENNPLVIATTARLFWADRKIQKARDWFHRSVTLEPDNGDSWAWFYKFETQHGDENSQAAVVERVKAAEPRHGETWQKVSKRTENWNQEPQEILMMVVKEIK